METYDLKKPEEEAVPDFEYVYPENLDIDNNVFVHVGFGLYMISQEDAKSKLTADSVAKYSRLMFVGFQNEVLFACSKRYSCWNEEIIKWCLLENLSMLHIPQNLVPKVNEIIDRIRKAEERNSWRESLVSCGDPWSIPEEGVELDAPFDFSKERKKDKYVMLNGKVGTKIADGVYKFKAPFQVNITDGEWNRLEGLRYYLPSISYYDNAINHDCVVLYEEVWSGGTISVLEELDVYYVAFDENNVYIKKAADFYNLKVKVFHKTEEAMDNRPAVVDMDKLREEIEKEINNRPKIDVPGMFLKAGYKEVFQGLGYQGKWEISYLKLFDFNRYPQSITATYVAFTEKGIIYCSEYENPMEAGKVLPYDMLKYLRVDVEVPCELTEKQNCSTERIGHTFIAMNDEKETALVGADNVRLLKEVIK